MLSLKEGNITDFIICIILRYLNNILHTIPSSSTKCMLSYSTAYNAVFRVSCHLLSHC